MQTLSSLNPLMRISFLTNSQFVCLLLIIISLFLPQTYSATSVTVTSSSIYVGELTTYTYSISNHDSPTKIQFYFGTWSPRRSLPFQLDYECYYGGTTKLSCTLRSSQTVIECSLPSSLSSSFTVKLSNINNPSSTKPLNLFITLVTATAFQTISKTLTVTSLQQLQFYQVNHNKTVGASSTAIEWYLVFDYYFNSNTFLKITYDSTTFPFDFGSLTTCSISSQFTGGVILSSWTDDSSNVQILKPIKIVNPKGAISNYQISATLYFTEGAANYSISNFKSTLTLTTIQFTSVQGTTSLQLGVPSQTFSITALSCLYTPQNFSTTNQSYTTVQFNKTYFTSSSCPSGTFSETTELKSCQYSTSLATKSVNSITTPVTSSASFFVTVTSYTYISGYNYVPLCSKTYTASFVTQTITTPTFDKTLCNSTKTTGSLNSVTKIIVPVQNWAAGDTLKFYGIQGLPYSPWLVSSSVFTYTFESTDSTTVLFPYYNPTFTTSTNSITSIEVYRPSIALTYAKYDNSVILCPVTSYSALASLSITLSSSFTYQDEVAYTFSFDCNFGDYVQNDYVQIQFVNFDNTLFLTLLENKLSAAILSKTQDVTVVSNSIIRVTLSEDQLIKSTDINKLTVSGFVNPPVFLATYSVKLKLGNGEFSSIKEQGTVNFPTLAISSLTQISQSSNVAILVKNRDYTLSFTNSLRYKYLPSVASNVTIQIPMVCSTSLNDLTWPLSTQTLTITLQNCTVPFLTSQNATITIRQTINEANSTNTIKTLALACQDYCLKCSSSKVCSECVSTADSTYNLLYSGSCYESCPTQTFQVTNSFTCQNCYETCASCLSPALTECTSCMAYYKLSSIVIDQTSIDICISTCGQNKYFDTDLQSCEDCEIDCKYCIDKNICFICKDGASLVSQGECDFTSCDDQCGTCSGSTTNCTSCTSSYYLFQYQCFEQCPTSTYADQQLGICLEFTGSNLYFPALICTVILIIIVCICNKLTDSDMTQIGRQHINVITYCSAIFPYMQLFALFIMLILTPNSTSKALGVVGIVIWIGSNIGFCVYYNLKIKDDDAVSMILNKMGSRSKCIYYAVLGLSVVFNLRTYRILYCGIFKGVTPYLYVPIKEDREKKYATNEIANEAGQNKKKDASQVQSQDQSTKFQLKKPITLYLTIVSLLGSFFFLIAAAVEITENYFINMLIWGLDLLIVVLASIVITLIDIWAGLKKSYLLALQKNLTNNETLQNLQEEDGTQKKILRKDKTKKKMNKYSPTKQPQKKAPQKKFSSLKKGNKSKSPNKPKPRQLSPQEKARKQQSERLKKINSQYSGLYKKKSQRNYESDEEDEIPDIKIFDSIDFKQEDGDRPERIRKIQTEHQKMRSTHNLGKGSRNMQNNNKGRQTSMSWKMSDIFLGFLDGEDQLQQPRSGLRSNDEKKTVKVRDKMKNKGRDRYDSGKEEENDPNQIGKIEFKENLYSGSQQNTVQEMINKDKKIEIKLEDDFEQNG